MSAPAPSEEPVAPEAGIADRLERSRLVARNWCDHVRGIPGSPKTAIFASYAIHLVAAGEVRYTAGDRTHRARAGSILVTGPGRALEMAEGGAEPEIYYAHFRSAAGYPDPLLDLRLPLVARAPDLARARSTFVALLRAIRARDHDSPWAPLRVQLHLKDLLATAFEAGSEAREVRLDPGSEAPAWVWEAFRHLCGNLADPELTIERLADAAGLSPGHFSRRFARHVGITPKRMIVQRRIDRAGDFLRTDVEMPVNEVARRCGFADPYNFSAQFKRRTGLSPSAFRDEHGQGDGTT